MFRYCLFRTAMGFGAGWILYRKLILCIPVAGLFFVISIFGKKSLQQKERSIMSGKFREFLICLEPLLRSGGTFAKAFGAAVEDYEKMYGMDMLLPALKTGISGFSLNKSPGKALERMAERIGTDDALLFSCSIETCEATGADVIEITKNTISILTEKVRMEKEIETILSAKKFEHLLISLIPAAVILLMSAGSDSYMSPLYSTVQGRMAMTLAGIVFGIGWIAGRRITKVEV